MAFDNQTVASALIPLARALGLDELPLGPTSGEVIAALGYTPSLVRVRRPVANDPGTYYVRTADGSYRPIGGGALKELGFPVSDAIQVRSPESLGALGPVSSRVVTPGAVPALKERLLASASEVGPFMESTIPFREPTTGRLLPVPGRVAGTLNRIRLTNPLFYGGLLSGYAAGPRGIDPTAVQHAVDTLTPRGTLNFQSPSSVIGFR